MLLQFTRRPVPWWSGQAIRWEITRQLRQTTWPETTTTWQAAVSHPVRPGRQGDAWPAGV